MVSHGSVFVASRGRILGQRHCSRDLALKLHVFFTPGEWYSNLLQARVVFNKTPGLLYGAVSFAAKSNQTTLDLVWIFFFLLKSPFQTRSHERSVREVCGRNDTLFSLRCITVSCSILPLCTLGIVLRHCIGTALVFIFDVLVFLRVSTTLTQQEWSQYFRRHLASIWWRNKPFDSFCVNVGVSWHWSVCVCFVFLFFPLCVCFACFHGCLCVLFVGFDDPNAPRMGSRFQRRSSISPKARRSSKSIFDLNSEHFKKDNFHSHLVKLTDGQTFSLGYHSVGAYNITWVCSMFLIRIYAFMEIIVRRWLLTIRVFWYRVACCEREVLVHYSSVVHVCLYHLVIPTLHNCGEATESH